MRGPNSVLCKTCSVLCVLEQPRIYNSSGGPIGLRPVLRICICLYHRIFTIYTNINMALSTYFVYPHECAPVSITVISTHTCIYTCLYSRISTKICTCLCKRICTIRTNAPVSIIVHVHVYLLSARIYCLNQRIFNIHTNMHLSVPTYGFCPHEYAPVCTPRMISAGSFNLCQHLKKYI